MDETSINQPISGMDILTSKKFQKDIGKHIRELRSKNTVKLEAFVSAEKKNALLLSIDWLFTHGFIKKKTRYAFLKFAVDEMMKNVLAQHEKELEQKQQEAIRISQGQAPPRYENQNTSKPPYNRKR